MTINTTQDPDPLDDMDRRFGDRVAQARKVRRMTQQQLVDALNSEYGLGWYQQTIGRLEAGNRQTRLPEAVAIATVLDVPLTELVYGTSHPLPTVEAAERAYDELDALHRRLSKMIEDRKLELRMEATEAVVQQAQRRYLERQDEQKD